MKMANVVKLALYLFIVMDVTNLAGATYVNVGTSRFLADAAKANGVVVDQRRNQGLRNTARLSTRISDVCSSTWP